MSVCACACACACVCVCVASIYIDSPSGEPGQQRSTCPLPRGDGKHHTFGLPPHTPPQTLAAALHQRIPARNGVRGETKERGGLVLSILQPITHLLLDGDFDFDAARVGLSPNKPSINQANLKRGGIHQ